MNHPLVSSLRSPAECRRLKIVAAGHRRKDFSEALAEPCRSIIEILESESNADAADSKVTRVDMRVRDGLDRKAYEAFQNDLHQQASMYEESFGKLAEARQMLEKERRQKEEAQREKEELARAALEALLAAGIPAAEAREKLGL